VYIGVTRPFLIFVEGLHARLGGDPMYSQLQDKWFQVLKLINPSGSSLDSILTITQLTVGKHALGRSTASRNMMEAIRGWSGLQRLALTLLAHVTDAQAP
jgi:hypothetical protein